MKDLEKELDELFRAWREAVPGPDASAQFMPSMWEKIEARRTLVFRVRHLARAFLGATAVLCTLMAGVFLLEANRPGPVPTESYLDSLAYAHANESMLDAMHVEAVEGRR